MKVELVYLIGLSLASWCTLTPAAGTEENEDHTDNNGNPPNVIIFLVDDVSHTSVKTQHAQQWRTVTD